LAIDDEELDDGNSIGYWKFVGGGPIKNYTAAPYIKGPYSSVWEEDLEVLTYSETTSVSHNISIAGGGTASLTEGVKTVGGHLNISYSPSWSNSKTSTIEKSKKFGFPCNDNQSVIIAYKPRMRIWEAKYKEYNFYYPNHPTGRVGYVYFEHHHDTSIDHTCVDNDEAEQTVEILEEVKYEYVGYGTGQGKRIGSVHVGPYNTRFDGNIPSIDSILSAGDDGGVQGGCTLGSNVCYWRVCSFTSSTCGLWFSAPATGGYPSGWVSDTDDLFQWIMEKWNQHNSEQF